MNEEVTEPTLEEDASSQFYGESETVLNESETTETELQNTQESEAAQTEEDNGESSESEPSDASKDQDQPNIELSSIALALGLDESDLDIDEDGLVVYKSKIDGQESTAKARDTLATYQKQGHLDNKLRDANVREENLKAQETNLQAQAQQRFQQSEDLNNIALRELYAESNQIDWQMLRDSDPGEFAAKQQDYKSREASIKQALGYTARQRQETEEANRQGEVEKAVSLMPGWNDPDVAKKEASELESYLSENKMNPILSNYADTYVLLKKAKAYDALTESKPEIKKLVNRAPKVGRKRAQAKPAETPKSDADYFY